MDIRALKRLITAPFRMNKKEVIVLAILLTIFAGALYLRLSVTLGWGLPLGRDGPYQFFNVQYLVSHWPSMHVADPPLFFHFTAGLHGLLSGGGASLMTSFNISTSLVSALVAITTFFLTRRLTKNTLTALVAAMFSGFVCASFRMLGELQKNALGVSLAPLSPLFFWKGMESGKKIYLLISGVFFGLTMLSHELAGGTLGIAYLSYIAFLIGYRKRLPFAEIKAMVIMLIPAALVGGWCFYTRIGGTTAIAASGSTAAAGSTGEDYLRFYNDFIGPLLLVLAAVGAGVAAYRRRAQDFFMLAWGMSALIVAQPWVEQGYQWRVVLQLATPAVILAAMGLVDGIGAAFKKLDERVSKPRRSGGKSWKKFITPFNIAFICILVGVVGYQVSSGYSYAWTGEQLQPSISQEEYNALVELHQQIGDAYVFGNERYMYWSDAVGFKGGIQGGAVWDNLSRMLSNSPSGGTQMLENGQLFVLIFDKSSLRSYRIAENITLLAGPSASESLRLASSWRQMQENVGGNIYAIVPRMQGPGGYTQPGPKTFSSAARGAQPPLDNNPPPQDNKPMFPGQSAEKQSYLSLLASNPVRILIFPIDLIDYAVSGLASSVLKFAVGVPLTVMIWVLLPCLLWGLVCRVVKPSEKTKLKIRMVLIACVVLVLVVTTLLVVRGQERGPGPGGQLPPGGYQPPGVYPPPGPSQFLVPNAVFSSGANESYPPRVRSSCPFAVTNIISSQRTPPTPCT